MFISRLFRLPVTLALLAGIASGCLLPSDALAVDNARYRRVWDARARQYVFVREASVADKTRSTIRDAGRNTIIKQSAIGAGVGAAAGALSGNGALRGAGIGALTGAGTGLIDRSRILEDKPLVRTAVKGAAIGTATSVLTRGDNHMNGAAAGAAAGAGVHFIREFMDGDRNRDRDRRW